VFNFERSNRVFDAKLHLKAVKDWLTWIEVIGIPYPLDHDAALPAVEHVWASAQRLARKFIARRVDSLFSDDETRRQGETQHHRPDGGTGLKFDGLLVNNLNAFHVVSFARIIVRCANQRHKHECRWRSSFWIQQTQKTISYVVGGNGTSVREFYAI